MNWLAIIIAAIANMIIGFLWYGNWAFGRSWVSLSGRDMGGNLNPGPTITPSGPIVYLGLALIIGGAAFALWAASTLGSQFDLEPEVHRDHAVVSRGPYRVVRHPVYVGLAVHLAGACLASGNLLLSLGVAFVGLPLLYLRARAEEQLLRDHLGPAYETYVRDTGMFLPRLRRRAR